MIQRKRRIKIVAVCCVLFKGFCIVWCTLMYKKSLLHETENSHDCVPEWYSVKRKNRGRECGKKFHNSLGPWRSRFVCLLILLSSLILIYFRFHQVKVKRNFNAISSFKDGSYVCSILPDIRAGAVWLVAGVARDAGAGVRLRILLLQVERSANVIIAKRWSTCLSPSLVPAPGRSQTFQIRK